MKAKKAIKKIVALGMGATMLGATMLGASAADLSNYPNMFMKDNQFNGLLVVGKNADAVDTIGMSNVAMGLQAASVTETQVCTGDSSVEVSVDEGVKIEESGDKMYINNSIADVTEKLDDSDLPNVLADGEYNDNEGATDNDQEYSQELQMTSGTGVFGVFQDKDGAEEAGYYLKFVDDDDMPVYNYTFEFDSSVEFETDNAVDESLDDDLESTTIDIQGQVYTITDVKFDSSDEYVEEVTMLAGETMQWLTQGDVVTKTDDQGVDHEIEMIDVTEGADACGLEVDGSTVWIDVDDTEEVNGITLGVTDAKAVHTETYDADICKVNFGSQELVLEDGQEVQKQGKDVDGTDVKFLDGASAGEWDGFEISYTPEDTVYLGAEEELVDPVFGNFKFVFGGEDRANLDEVNYDVSGTTGTMSFTNADGKEVSMDIYLDEDNDDVYLGTGTDADERVYFGDKGASAAQCVFGASPVQENVDDCEGARWLFSVGGEAHQVELSAIDWDDSESEYEIELEDITYDSTDTVTFDTGANGTMELDVSGIGKVKIDIVNTTGAGNEYIAMEVDPITGGTDAIETENQMELTDFEYAVIGTGGNQDLSVNWTEEEGSEVTGTQAVWDAVVESDEDGSDPELKVRNPTGTGVLGPVDFSEDNDDDVWYLSDYGTMVLYDNDESQSYELTYPDDDVTGSVFVSPTSAMVTTSGTDSEGCQVAQEVQKIGSQVTKFDTEVGDATAQDVISIGGPCANAVTSALMGNPEVCSEGFESGMALLKLVENGDNTALVVAGGTGKDTRIASTVLQEYSEYSEELTGSELKLTTVSESNIGFESVE